MLFEFICCGHRFALPFSCVQRVMPSAWPALLPGAPDVVLGVLNADGEVITVLDFFGRAALPFAGIDPSHQIVVARIGSLSIGLVVDKAVGIVPWQPNENLSVPEPLAAAAWVQGLLRFENGLCIILDLEKFLMEEERSLIDRALQEIHYESQ